MAVKAHEKPHIKTYQEKDQHVYVYRKQVNSEGYNKKLSNSWLSKPSIISHAEGYIFAIQEQEINTRALKSKREQKNNAGFDANCRFCHRRTEDIFHLLCTCDQLSASLFTDATRRGCESYV